MNIGFALIVGSPLLEEIIKLENGVHDQAGFYNTLGPQHCMPHTTIFQGTFVDDVPYIEIADEIANYYRRNIKNFIPTFTRIVYVPSGWYFYECEKKPSLQLLHNYTCKCIKPFLALDSARMSRDLSYLTMDQIKGIEEYGYRYSGNAFYPHITIGRRSGEDIQILRALNSGLEKLTKNVPFTRLTVYQMGPNGTHLNTLHEIIL